MKEIHECHSLNEKLQKARKTDHSVSRNYLPDPWIHAGKFREVCVALSYIFALARHVRFLNLKVVIVAPGASGPLASGRQAADR